MPWDPTVQPAPFQRHDPLDAGSAGELVRLTTHETVSRAKVGRRLAEMKLKPWREKMWCIPTVTAEYVARMEDVLDLYAETPDPRRPVVCFDETPRQLIGKARVPNSGPVWEAKTLRTGRRSPCRGRCTRSRRRLAVYSLRNAELRAAWKLFTVTDRMLGNLGDTRKVSGWRMP